MVVLVAYASRHGATAEIAEHLATGLGNRGVPARAVPVDQVRDVRAFDAVVLGAAAYSSHWLKAATMFARRNRVALRERPVWLFSSGPLGTEPVDSSGRDLRLTCRPKEFEELVPLLRARGEQVFFGAFNPEDRPVTIGEHVFAMLPGAHHALPAGDFRDWAAIDDWAGMVAAVLAAETLPS